MTRYTVVWHNTARDELARLWLASSDKQGLSDAANEIDRELATDADTKGNAVRNHLRELTLPPLRVLFSVSEADRMVRVLAVALS